jgi:hypothetical protein
MDGNAVFLSSLFDQKSRIPLKPGLKEGYG